MAALISGPGYVLLAFVVLLMAVLMQSSFLFWGRIHPAVVARRQAESDDPLGYVLARLKPLGLRGLRGFPPGPLIAAVRCLREH